MKIAGMRRKAIVKVVEYVNNPDGLYMTCTDDIGTRLILKIQGVLCSPPPQAETVGKEMEIEYQTYRPNQGGTRPPELAKWEYWIKHEGIDVRITSRRRKTTTPPE